MTESHPVSPNHCKHGICLLDVCPNCRPEPPPLVSQEGEAFPQEMWIVRYPDAPGRCYAYPTKECAKEMHSDLEPIHFVISQAAPPAPSLLRIRDHVEQVYLENETFDPMLVLNLINPIISGAEAPAPSVREALAKALCALAVESHNEDHWTWDEANEGSREGWRKDADRILSAIAASPSQSSSPPSREYFVSEDHGGPNQDKTVRTLGFIEDGVIHITGQEEIAKPTPRSPPAPGVGEALTPFGESIQLVREFIGAMAGWGSEEDGIPEQYDGLMQRAITMVDTWSPTVREGEK